MKKGSKADETPKNYRLDWSTLGTEPSSEKDWLYGDSLLPQLERRSIYRKH